MSPAPLIHVVDDDESLRTALLRLLASCGYDARGYSSTGEFLLHRPDDRRGCVLLDLRLPGPSGLELQAALRDHEIHLPVVFLTGHGDVASSVRAMKAGAVDFLTKPIQREALLDAIGRALARDAADRQLRLETEALRARFASLTVREREVVDGIASGHLNKEIAHELGMAERTVKLHRAHALEKLGVTSAAELGALAERFRQLGES